MSKTSGLRIRIDPEVHRDFLDACARQDVSASHVLRDFIRNYLKEYKASLQADFFEPQNLEKNQSK